MTSQRRPDPYPRTWQDFLMENASPDYSQFMRMWMEFMSKMAANGAIPAPDPLPNEAAREVRDAWFQALNRNTEQFLRSPQFLEMMKQSTDLAVAMRQQLNEFLTQSHHAVGAVARPDIDSLLMAIRRCETRVLDKLDELSARLDMLEENRTAEADVARPARKSK